MFQAKVEKLLVEIDRIKVYIYDIIVFGKGGLYQDIDQLRVIFVGMCTTVIQVNVPNCSFGLNDITYLGYIITWEGIKPDLNKVHGIMDIERSTTMTEV